MILRRTLKFISPKKVYVEYSGLLKKEAHLQRLKEMGFIFIPKRTYKTLGLCLIIGGLLTLPVPFTTAPLIALGVCLMGIDKQKLRDTLRHRYKLMRYKYVN